MSDDFVKEHLKMMREKDQQISNLQNVVAKLVSGHDVVKIYSDYWVKKNTEGEYVEMSVNEQMEDSI